MAIRNIIFDLDGTLIDSSSGVIEAVNYSLLMVGEAEQSPEVIKSFIGYPLSQMYRTFSSTAVDELYRHFQHKAAETVVESAEMLPGVEKTLTVLHDSKYRLAVASTKVRSHIDGILDKFNWRGLFAACAGADEVRQVKPDPEILRLTLQRLGATPQDTVAIGDTVNDVLAARAIPMQVVAVDSPYGDRRKVLSAGPDFLIKRLADLESLLENIPKEAL
jgi:HAD superfamily hydrolase (TIGR01509 family)